MVLICFYFSLEEWKFESGVANQSAPSPIEDPRMETEPGSFLWDVGLTGQFNAQAARYRTFEIQ